MGTRYEPSHGSNTWNKKHKKKDQHQFVKNMGRELREISDKVRPFNKNKEKAAVNPFNP